jgi:hypothetical protein
MVCIDEPTVDRSKPNIISITDVWSLNFTTQVIVVLVPSTVNVCTEFSYCIYIVKSSKSIVGDREKKRKLVIEVKDPLSFEIWIFRNGQTVRDDNRSILLLLDLTIYMSNTVGVL